MNNCVAKINVCCYFGTKMSDKKSFCGNSSIEDMFDPVNQKYTTFSNHLPFHSVDIPNVPFVQVRMRASASDSSLCPQQIFRAVDWVTCCLSGRYVNFTRRDGSYK